MPNLLCNACLCVTIKAGQYINIYNTYAIQKDFVPDIQVNNIMNNCCDFNDHYNERAKTKSFKQHL